MKIKRQKALCDANEDYIHQFAELGFSSTEIAYAGPQKWNVSIGTEVQLSK